MVRKSQSARMGRYTNLANNSASPKPRRAKRQYNGPLKRPINWFRNLTRKQKILVLIAPILIAMIVIPVVTYLMLQNDVKDPERLMNRNNTGIVLEDKNGKAFYTIGKAEHRTRVPLSGISKPMQQALLASEDKDFYKHGGVNIFSMARAAFTGYGGGSTLTQQLVKNTLLSDQRSYLRKYQEAFMAIAVEQNYSKDEILAMYLNSVYYGENAFGVEDAAKAYFNTTPDKLDVAQSAMLIGVLPAPSAYSPISGSKEYAKQRQTTVLSRMVKNGYITEQQKTEALAQELAYGEGASSANTTAPHYAEMVINQLSKKYGYEKVMRSGYQVKTSLDLDVQHKLQDSVAAAMSHINAMDGSNASGIVIDPKDGEIRALVGSADYSNDKWGKVNMVTTARQPGSSFKPIYYSYALADGVITPSTILDDKVMDFGGGYIPRDADKNEASRGKVSVRQALNWSLNIPSLHIIDKYGVSKAVTAANNLGIGLKTQEDHDITLALGSEEATLQKMTNAYAAFANQGLQFENHIVQDIKDKFGKKIFAVEHNGKQAINKEGAYLISNILSDNTTRSKIFGSSLTVPGHTVAVKTGTTNDNRDAWTIGYNTQYAVGVWVGNNNNSPMSSGGSDMAGPIWKNTFIKLLAGSRDTQFAMPDGIVQRTVCHGTGGLAPKTGPNTYSEYFMSGALPTENCTVEPVMVNVCEIATGKVVSIDEEKFDSATQSKDTENCKPPTIEVCELSTGDVVTIKESEFDDKKHSKDTANCQATAKPDTTTTPGTTSNNNAKIQACDTTRGIVVTIPQSQLDGTRYTTDTAACKKATTP